jgi:hypothetical protein
MTETSNWTRINVALPIPLDVAATLMTLIGTAYPTAVVDTTSAGFALSMKIDPKERARKVSKKQAAELLATRDDEFGDTDFHGFNDNGGIDLATPAELSHHLGHMAHQMFTQTDGAINYVEWEVRTAPDENGDDERYVLTIAKSKEQTPGSLLAEAKKRISELEAMLADAGSQGV